MNRFLLLVAVIVGLAASAVPADAKVTSKNTGQDADEVRAYWTSERMRNARPVERGRGGEPQEKAKPGGGGGSTSWSTLQVSWPSAPLITRAHGKVFFTEGGVNYVCSGTAVSSSSQSVVWTAGHCVNEGPGAFVTNWMFVPAYNSNGSEPYGRWPATSLYTTTAWRDRGEFGRDLGAAKVGLLSGQTLGERLAGQMRTLKFAVDYRTGAVNPIDAYGYPAAGKFNGESLYMCETYVSRVDGSTDPDTYGMPCGMTGGSSGGGWVDEDDNTVVSVVSYGYSGLKNTLFGPVQDSVAQSLLTSANAG